MPKPEAPTRLKPVASIAERFWSKVDMSGDCWNWKAAKLQCGYGQFSIGKDYYSASRIAFKLAYRECSTGKFVLHRCDNRACVRPSHLYEGTKADNTKDTLERGQYCYMRGEKNGNVKLTLKQVRKIRSLEGKMSQIALAKKFGVCKNQIGNIIRREKWAHV